VDRRRSHFVKASVAKKNVPEMTLIVSEKIEAPKVVSCAA
jgi:hypothetical protein